MRISDAEVKKILSHPEPSVVNEIDQIEVVRVRRQDQALVKELTADVTSMPDRDDLIAELRSRIEQGAYRPTAESIVEGMVRRAIADQVR
jgi:hypothetical protein